MSNMKNQTANEDLQTLLTLATERAAKAEADARAAREDLERAAQLARGTGDHTRSARAATEQPEPEQTLEGRVMSALFSDAAPMTFDQLCKAVDAKAGKVSATMRELRKAGRVYNLGSEDHPRWIGVCGDKTSTKHLNAWVKRLISLAPMTFSQLLAVTGSRRGRVSGALVALQRDPETRKRLQNLGNDRTYVWFLPTSPLVIQRRA